MRPFEWATVLLSALVLLSGQVDVLHVVVYPLVATFGCHLLLERPRVPMLGAYVVVPSVVYGTLHVRVSEAGGTDTTASGGSGNIPIWALVCGEILLALCVIVARAMPVHSFVRLTGPYTQLGMIRCVFKQSDTATDPPLTPTILPAPAISANVHHPPFADRLEMRCKVWYPAGTGCRAPSCEWLSERLCHLHPARATRGAPYLHGGWQTARALAQFGGLPSLLFHGATLSKLIAVENAPLATEQERFPVVIFCHGLGGTFDCYTVLAQDFASHGYIVVVPNFNDYSASISYLDDRVLGYHKPPNEMAPEEIISVMRTPQLRERAREVLFVRDSLLLSQKAVAAAAAGGSGVSVTTSSDNACACGDGVTDIRTLLPRMSLDSIGIAGHSFGAATAVLTIQTDRQLRPDVYGAAAASTVASAAGPTSAAIRADDIKLDISATAPTAGDAKNGHSDAAANGRMSGLASGRFAAAILHDMWTEPFTDEMLATGLSGTPTLAIESQQFFTWKPNHNRHMRLFEATPASAAATSYAYIRGSRHQNFTDLPYFSPGLSRLVTATGPIDLDRGFELIHYYDTIFLRKHHPNAALPRQLTTRDSLLPPPAPAASAEAAADGGADSHAEVIFAIGDIKHS